MVERVRLRKKRATRWPGPALLPDGRRRPGPRAKFVYHHDRAHTPVPDGRRPRCQPLAMVEMMRPLSFKQLREGGEVMLREVLLFAYGKDFAISFVTDDGTMNMTVKPQNFGRLGQIMIDLAERRIRHGSLELNQET